MARLLGEARVSILPDGTRFKSEAEAQIKKAQTGLNAKIQLMLDNKDLNAKIADVKAKIDDLKRQSAIISIDADDKKLIAKMAQVQATLDKVSNRVAKAKVDADISTAMAQVAAVDATLDDFGKKSVKAKAGVDTGGGETKLGILDVLLDKFGMKSVKAKADVDTGEGEAKLALFGAILDHFGGKSGGAGNNAGGSFGKGFTGGLLKSAVMQNPGITGLIIAGLGALPAAVGAIGVLGGIALGAGIIIGAESLLKKQLKTLTTEIKQETTIANSKTATAEQKKNAQDIIKQDQAQVDALNKQIGAFQVLNDAVGTLKVTFTQFAVVVSKPLIKPFADAINELSAQLKGPLAKSFHDLFAAVGPLVKPVVDSLLEIVDGILPGMTDMLRKAKGPLSDMFIAFGKIVGVKIGSWFEDAIPFIKDSAKYFNNLISAAGSLIGWLIKVGGALAIAFNGSQFKGFGPLLESIGTSLVKIIIPAFEGWTSVMGPVVKSIAQIVAPILAWMAANPGFVKGLFAMIAAFQILTKVLVVAAGVTEIFEGIFAALDIEMDANPIGLVVVAVVALAAAAFLIIKNWTPLVNWFKKNVYDGWMKYLLLLIPGVGGFAFTALIVAKYWRPVAGFFEQLGQDIYHGFILKMVAFFTNTVPHAFDVSIKALHDAWSGVANFFSGIWKKVSSVTMGVWNSITTALRDAWGHIENAATGVFKPIASVIEGVWNQVYKMTRDTWGFIYAVIKGINQVIEGTIVQAFRGIKAVTEEVWPWIYNTIKSVWGHIENVVTGTVKPIVSLIVGSWHVVMQATDAAWQWIFNTSKNAWGHIENTITGIVKPLVNWIHSAWTQLMQWTNAAWQWIYSTSKDAWGHIENVITGIVKPLVNWIKSAWDLLRNWTNDAWQWIFSVSKEVWGRIENAVTGIVKPMVTTIRGLWDDLKGWTSDAFNWIHNEIVDPLTRAWQWITKSFVPGIEGAFSNAVNGVKRIWSEIQGAIAGPIKFVVGTVYNDAIVPFWNNTAGVVGAKHINAVSLKGFATGGRAEGKIPGWDVGDRVPAMLEGGEAIVPKRLATSKQFSDWAGYHGIPGYATGGKTGGQGVNAPPPPGSPAAAAKELQRETKIGQGKSVKDNPGGIALVTPVVDAAKMAWDKIRQLGGDALAAVFSGIVNPLLGKIPGVSGGAAKGSPAASMPLQLIKNVESELVDWIKGHDQNDLQSGSASSMLAFMLSQKGHPYSQAARYGPNSWDCSGLVWGAAHASSVPMPGGPSNNSAAIVNPELQWAGGQGGSKTMLHPSNKDVKTGDLLGFTGSSDDHVTGNAKMLPGFKLKIGNIIANSMGHIGMAMNSSQFMSAYDTAVGCEPEPIDYPNLEVAVRLAGGAGGPETALAGSQASNGTAIYKYLLANLFGGNAVAAAGAIASIWGESGWNPESVGTGGFGLIGWTGNTLGLPAGYHGPTGNATKDLDIQIPAIVGFVHASGDQGTINEMMKAGSVLDAANEWGHGVERFGINDVHSAGVSAATEIMNSVSKGTTPAKELAAEKKLGFSKGGIAGRAFNLGGVIPEKVLGRGVSTGMPYAFGAGERVTPPASTGSNTTRMENLLVSLNNTMAEIKAYNAQTANNTRNTASGIGGVGGSLRR